MKVAVVGGGASGLVAAITASRNGAEVTILERNSDCAKKLLMTGNGRCNYWNQNQDFIHYHSENLNMVEKIITIENQKKVHEFFDSIGLLPKIKNGYYYPYSNQATCMKSLLLKEIELEGIQVLNYFFVEKIEKDNSKFHINPEKENLIFDKVILATGSRACPKTGSDGNGYSLVQSFGHSIVPVLPSLVQLKAKGSDYKDWDGIRTEVLLSLFIDDKIEKEESGEIQLTSYGISGICTFNISGLVAKALARNRKVTVLINFCPFASNEEEFLSWFTKRNHSLKLETVEDLLEGFLNYKLIPIILKRANLKKSARWKELSSLEKKSLASIIIQFPLEIIGTHDFEKAQVCSGGVPLEEMNPNTMESMKEKGLYLTGELLDVDGDCGGYNLGFAWISGIIAGNGVISDD